MKQVITRLVDDLDESDADETVTFALDGVSYEIDLTEKHAAELRDALLPFVSAGRKASSVAGGRVHRVNGRSNGTGGTGDRAFNRQVREWARAKGMPVNDRGRVAGDLVAEYRAEQSGTPAVRAAVEVLNPPGDGLDAMRVGTLRKLAADRGFSSLTRASKPAIVAALRANPDGPPAVAQNKAPKAAVRPVEAPKAPDLSQFTPTQRREMNEQVRRFARLHGYKISDKGRIPAEVYTAYEANDPSLLPKR